MSDSEAETWALSSASSNTGGCRGRRFVKIPKGLKSLLNELTTEVRNQSVQGKKSVGQKYLPPQVLSGGYPNGKEGGKALELFCAEFLDEKLRIRSEEQAGRAMADKEEKNAATPSAQRSGQSVWGSCFYL